jgi:hypothetical protein
MGDIMADDRGDIMRDDRDDVTWMTYAELGLARGISKESATRLSFRRKWRRQVGNDGIARVAVPTHEAKPQSDQAPDDRGDDADDIFRRMTSMMEAILAKLVVPLQEQLAYANARADAAERRAEAQTEVTRLHMEAVIAELRAMEQTAEQARADAQDAREALEASRQADAARKVQAFLPRFVEAVRIVLRRGG